MPVFTAFGWAGEEAAINYALSQLEEFVTRLHAQLPRDLQTRFPFAGLDRANQVVYLGSSTQIETAPYIIFYARPLTMEMQLVITDQMALSTAWKAAESDPERWFHELRELEDGWSLRVQQMMVDEDTGERTFSQDLYKDEINNLDLETARQIAERAAFLNGEPKWVVPIYVSYRISSEQAAMMGLKIFSVATEWVRAITPLFDFLTRRDSMVAKRKKARPRPASTVETVEEVPAKERFVFTTTLKALHINKGFVNLTPHHWPFFAENARMTTRPVTVAYENRFDKESAVWRLSHNDQARIVLGPAAREWLEENFEADDKIQITASKRDNDVIEVRLEPVAE